ncbi:MAG TPA: HEAT repeat domain-containing protein, partial [Bacteroidia bacterium]
ECSTFASIPEAAEVILAALNDKNPDLRERAIGFLEKLPAEYKEKAKGKLVELAKKDERSTVRSLAIDNLAANYKDQDLIPLYRNGVNDKSYLVEGSSISALAKNDEKEAMKLAGQFESEKNPSMLLSVAQIYSLYGNDSNNPFFTRLSQKMNGWENISFANTYTEFLKRCSDDTITAGIKILENIARNEENNRWVRYFGQKGIKDLAQMYSDREQKLSGQISQLKEKQANSPELVTLEQQLAQTKHQKQKLTSLYESMATHN